MLDLFARLRFWRNTSAENPSNVMPWSRRISLGRLCDFLDTAPPLGTDYHAERHCLRYRSAATYSARNTTALTGRCCSNSPRADLVAFDVGQARFRNGITEGGAFVAPRFEACSRSAMDCRIAIASQDQHLRQRRPVTPNTSSSRFTPSGCSSQTISTARLESVTVCGLPAFMR
jgi:hypothetical protein